MLRKQQRSPLGAHSSGPQRPAGTGSPLRVRPWKGGSRRTVSGSHPRSQLAPRWPQAMVSFACKVAHVRPLSICRTTWWPWPCATEPWGLSVQSWTRGRHTEVSGSLLAQARGAHGGKKLFNGRGACFEDPPPVVRRSGQKFHGVTCDSPPAWQVKVGQQKPPRGCPPPLWQEGSTPASSPRLAPAQEEQA